MAVADYNTVQEFCNTLHDHVKKSTHYHMMTDLPSQEGVSPLQDPSSWHCRELVPTSLYEVSHVYVATAPNKLP